MGVKEQLALDVVQFALDLVGIVDPTGVADGISGLIALGRGKWLDAAISGLSMVPYIGDLAKTAKLPRYVRSVGEAIKLAAKDHKFAAELKPALEQLKAALDKVPLDRLPAAAQGPIRTVKAEIDTFLQRRLYNPNPKHELPGGRGRKGTRLDLTADEAYQLLNDPVNCLEVIGKKQFVAVKNKKIYVYQPDGTGGYHAYPSTGNEVFTNYPTVAKRVADLLGTDIKRLSRMTD
jgi:hypothetical protein